MLNGKKHRIVFIQLFIMPFKIHLLNVFLK